MRTPVNSWTRLHVGHVGTNVVLESADAAPSVVRRLDRLVGRGVDGGRREVLLGRHEVVLELLVQICHVECLVDILDAHIESICSLGVIGVDASQVAREVHTRREVLVSRV